MTGIKLNEGKVFRRINPTDDYAGFFVIRRLFILILKNRLTLVNLLLYSYMDKGVLIDRTLVSWTLHSIFSIYKIGDDFTQR